MPLDCGTSHCPCNSKNKRSLHLLFMIIVYLDGCNDVKTNTKPWKRPIHSLYRTKPVSEKYGVMLTYTGCINTRKDNFSTSTLVAALAEVVDKHTWSHGVTKVKKSKGRSGQSRLLRAVSRCVLNTSRDGDPTASLGNLFKYLIVPRQKIN